MNINTESQKNPDQLEREVDERRAHMSETLSALEEKLSPGHMIDQVLAYTRTNGGEFSQNLVNTIKRNPVPSVLTAVGLAWLMFDQNKSSGSISDSTYGIGKTTYGATGSTGIQGSATQVKDKASGSLADAKYRAGETTDKLRQQAHQASESLRHQGERARAGFADLLEQQPLALGAIGIGLGALIGGSLPPSQREDQLFGEARDRLAHQAAEVSRDAYEKTKDLGHRMAQEIPSSPERPSSYTTQ